MKTISSGRSLKSVAITACSKVSVLAELVIILTADRVAIIIALNRLRDQIFINGIFRILITAIAAAMDVGRFRRWRDWRKALIGGRRLSAGGRCIGRMIPGA